MLKLVSQSNLDCGFAVASFVAVTYDWGEHDSVQELLIPRLIFPALTFGQEVC